MRNAQVSIMKITTVAALAAAMTVIAVFGVRAEPADDKAAELRGHSIATESDVRDYGFGDFTADVDMVLSNRNGAESRRRMHIKVLEGALEEGHDEGDKSLIVLVRPRDIEGTALLTFSHNTKNDEQWVYLPVLKRVKRVSSTNKSGPFIGSEFAYEDLVWADVERYTYKWIRDEAIDDVPTHVVERRPVYKNSGYSRQLVWYDAEELRVLRIEFFDRTDTLLKVMTAKGYQKYEGSYWRADELFMANLQNGKSTRLLWQDYSFRNGLTAKEFNKDRLRNLR